ncbi:MAG: PIN domain-containing protein [Desertifilum sp.]|nr:PIN domain-containing protein [Desertifilum sp.]
MVFLNTILGTRVYLDTNIFIYAFEGYPEFATRLTELFTLIDEGSVSAVTSELTLAEVLVKPFIDNNQHLQQVYQQALQSIGGLEVISIGRPVLIEAARVRSHSSSLRLPDAIHGATALLSGCSTFLTNDRRLLSLPGLQVVIFSELT